MCFRSSRLLATAWLVLLLAASVFGQTTVVASVNNIDITQQQVDDSVSARIYPLQQQL
jgi:hypothetical protein